MFLAGSVVGAIASSIAMYAARWPLGVLGEPVRMAVLVAALVALATVNARFVPQARRQIPSTRLMPGPLGFFNFGVEYGTGLRTYLPSRIPHVVAVLLLLAPGVSLVHAVLAGAGFGITRALPALAVPAIDTSGAVRKSVSAAMMALGLIGATFWAV